MKQIIDYITEKIKLSKDTVSGFEDPKFGGLRYLNDEARKECDAKAMKLVNKLHGGDKLIAYMSEFNKNHENIKLVITSYQKNKSGMIGYVDVWVKIVGDFTPPEPILGSSIRLLIDKANTYDEHMIGLLKKGLEKRKVE